MADLIYPFGTAPVIFLRLTFFQCSNKYLAINIVQRLMNLKISIDKASKLTFRFSKNMAKEQECAAREGEPDLQS